jgi:hypothetical protein
MSILGVGCKAGSPRGERGESNIGCIVLLVLVGIVSWIGFKIGKTYFDRQALNEKVNQEIMLFQAKSDDEMRQVIYAEAALRNIPIRIDDIHIARPSKGRIEIKMKWNVDVAFPFDKHFRKTMKIEEEAHISY